MGAERLYDAGGVNPCSDLPVLVRVENGPAWVRMGVAWVSYDPLTQSPSASHGFTPCFWIEEVSARARAHTRMRAREHTHARAQTWGGKSPEPMHFATSRAGTA